jgi:hypothetical protein
VVYGECDGKHYEDEGSSGGWRVVEVAGMVLHDSVCGGSNAAVVASGEGEVLQLEGKKRGEARSKKEGRGDQNSELTRRRQ